MLIKSEQLSVGSLIKNVMLKYLFWASYILRLCAQTCTPNRHALDIDTENDNKCMVSIGLKVNKDQDMKTVNIGQWGIAIRKTCS